ncbi:hypothetical protein D3C71_1642800 [compost metagenome]
MRIFQQARTEGVRYGTSLISKHPGQQPGYTVDNHHGRQFTARQHIVSNRKFVGNQVLPDPFIISLIVSANKDKAILAGELFCFLLCERLPLRAHQDDSRRTKRFGLLPGRIGFKQAFYGIEYGLRL